MKKFGICGHYGGNENFTDGQTVKTKIFTKHLKKMYGEDNVSCLDTYKWRKYFTRLLFGAVKLSKECENIVIVPAWNGVVVLIPLFLFLNKFYHRKIHYLVLGAWITELLERKPSLIKKIKKLDTVFAETKVSEESLKALGLENVRLVPNGKDLNIVSQSGEKTFSEPYPVLTFSRVEKLKGIEEACEIVKYVNQKAGRTVYILDIYGPVDPAYVEDFEKLQKTFPEYISYKGVAPYEGAEEILKDYFALLFPTRYETEGLPGALLDAYAAGVPVIAVEWQSSHEFIDHNRTGVIVDFSLENHVFEDVLIKASEEPEYLLNMRKNCLKEADKYQAANVVKKFADIATGKENL